MSPGPQDRRGLLVRPLGAATVLTAGLLVWRLPAGRLARAFLDVGWDGFRLPWAVAALVAVGAMLGTLGSTRVDSRLGRAGAAVAGLMVTVAVAIAGIDDPATAVAVGGCLGVLSAFAAALAFGVEGEGGVVWLGVLVAGVVGIATVAGVAGALDEWASRTGALWAQAALNFVGVGTLGLGGALAALPVLALQERLARYDRALLNVLAGALTGALAASVVRSFV